MRRKTALRLLAFVAFLPTSLAAMVCYDIVSPMHPEILVPVKCWPDHLTSTSHCSEIKKTPIVARANQNQGNNNQGNDNQGPEQQGPGHDSPVPGHGPAMPAAVPAETAPAPVFTDAQPPTDSKPNPTTPAVGPAFQPLFTSNLASAPATPPMATTPPTVPNHEQPNTHAGPNKPPEPTDEQQSPSPPPEQTASPKNPSPSQGNGNNGGDNDNGREGQPEQPNLPYFNFAPDSPLSQILEAPALSPPSWEEDQAVFFNLDCNVSGDICKGMSETLDLAGWYVSQVSSPCSNFVLR